MSTRDSSKEAEGHSKEILERVAAAYPYMFRPKRGEEEFFKWNPEINHGWLDIFERLCGAIDKELTFTQKKRFRLFQVKEKFGGLRVYWEMGSRSRPWADFQGQGEGVITLKPKTRKKSVADRIEHLIAGAAAEAAITCEKCGVRPATLRAGGWLVTLCDAHAQEMEEEDRE
jgi:hypothetical protein